jgi:hypothetical protein
MTGNDARALQEKPSQVKPLREDLIRRTPF